LSEFGALNETSENLAEIDRIISIAANFFHSWTYWQYKYFDDIISRYEKPGSEGFWTEDGEL